MPFWHPGDQLVPCAAADRIHQSWTGQSISRIADRNLRNRWISRCIRCTGDTAAGPSNLQLGGGAADSGGKFCYASRFTSEARAMNCACRPASSGGSASNLRRRQRQNLRRPGRRQQRQAPSSPRSAPVAALRTQLAVPAAVHADAPRATSPWSTARRRRCCPAGSEPAARQPCLIDASASWLISQLSLNYSSLAERQALPRCELLRFLRRSAARPPGAVTADRVRPAGTRCSPMPRPTVSAVA